MLLFKHLFKSFVMPDMRRMPVFLSICLFYSTIAGAQDTLPKFSVTARSTGKILISWHNNFASITKISIQRSSDSLKNFTTLLTVPDPRLPENGAVDNRALDPNFFYRLFIVLENGNYLFSKSQRPHPNSVSAIAKDRDLANDPGKDLQKDPLKDPLKDPSKDPLKDPHDIDPGDEDSSVDKMDRQRVRFLGNTSKERPAIKGPLRIRARPDIEIEKIVYLKKGDSVIGELSNKQIRGFRDSILNRTKDTLVFIDGDTLLVKSFVPKEVYKISAYVFTGKFGNIHVKLPEAAKRNYSLKFFDDGNKLLFELTAIRDPTLILDKTNFQHAGWFRFELYEENKLKEKNKLFIPKDF
jgi:hypothetical protein